MEKGLQEKEWSFGIPEVEIRLASSYIDKSLLPAYSTDGAAGLDLVANIPSPLTVQPGEVHLVGTGIHLNIKNKHIAATILPRSGLGSKHGIVLGNLVGLIDSDYQGQVMVSVWNRSDCLYTIQPGERICQMIFIPIIHPRFTIVENFSTETQRGHGGFGHTGK